MATAFGSYTSGTTLAAGAVADKVLRIRRLLVSTSVDGYVHVVTDSAGAATPIAPTIYVRQAGDSTVDLWFDSEPLNGERGKDVAIVAFLSGDYSLYFEYEVVE